MTLTVPRRSDPESERREIQRVTDRLVQQFPELKLEEIERAVYGKYSDFDSSPIRDFVPVLVERSARSELNRYPEKAYRA